MKILCLKERVRRERDIGKKTAKGVCFPRRQEGRVQSAVLQSSLRRMTSFLQLGEQSQMRMQLNIYNQNMNKKLGMAPSPDSIGSIKAMPWAETLVETGEIATLERHQEHT